MVTKDYCLLNFHMALPTIFIFLLCCALLSCVGLSYHALAFAKGCPLSVTSSNITSLCRMLPVSSVYRVSTKGSRHFVDHYIGFCSSETILELVFETCNGQV